MVFHKNPKTIGALSYIGLLIIWGLIELVIVPFMGRWLSTHDIEFIKEAVFKIVIWLVPAILLCRYYDNFLKEQEYEREQQVLLL